MGNISDLEVVLFYESLIDGIDFGTIAGYLRNPRSPIQFLLHVKERSMLAHLAELITREFEGSFLPGGQLPTEIEDLIQTGSLKLSTRDGIGSETASHFVSAFEIDPSAPCDVIYLEPFYLVHTPSLF
jgi:hypothetical protein